MASNAFIPSQGTPAACAVLPKYSTLQD